MTTSKALLTALLLAGSTAFAVDPQVSLLPGGAPTGTEGDLVVYATPGTLPIVGATIMIKFEIGKMTTAATTAKLIAGPDYVTLVPSTDVNYDAANGVLNLNLAASGDGQVAAGPMLTIKATQVGAGFGGCKVTLDPGTNLTLFDIATYDYPSFYPAQQDSALINGKVKKLTGESKGAPATGGSAAVAVGTKLYVVNDDLTAKAGWESGIELGGVVTGRPAFGVVGGNKVVAVGTTAGNGFVIPEVAPTASPIALGGAVKTAPAIFGGKVYWAVEKASGPVVKVDAAEWTIGAAGDKVTASPAIFGNLLVVGTDKAAKAIRLDGTPQANIATGNIAVSPIVVGGAGFVASSTGVVTKYNPVTGSAAGTTTIAGAPLSEPFGLVDTVYYGTSTGNVVPVAVATGVAGAPINFGTAAIVGIVKAGASVYVSDATGKVGILQGSSITVGGPVGSAIAASAVAGGVLVVNTQDGSIISLNK